MDVAISLAAANRLTVAGLSPGWLSAWMCSAGYTEVLFRSLDTEAWEPATGEQTVIGQAGEIMRMEARLAANPDFILSAASSRCPITFYCESRKFSLFLLDVRDVIYRRNLWLPLLADTRSVHCLNIWMGDDEQGTELEPGLRGGTMPVPAGSTLLNSEGLLPEEQLVRMLAERGLRVRFAESCTAGGMCERLSRMPGASAVLDRGWVVYSNQAKQEMLHVPEALIRQHGAVSREVVEAMAQAGSDDGIACVAVSGIAGPGGGSPEKPPGTVWVAVALPCRSVVSRRFDFEGARAEVRTKTVLAGFTMLIRLLSGPGP